MAEGRSGGGAGVLTHTRSAPRSARSARSARRVVAETLLLRGWFIVHVLSGIIRVCVSFFARRSGRQPWAASKYQGTIVLSGVPPKIDFDVAIVDQDGREDGRYREVFSGKYGVG